MDITQFANLSHVDPRFHSQYSPARSFTSETKPTRLQALLEAGVDLDAPNLFGQTPLFVASWQLGSGNNRMSGVPEVRINGLVTG